MIYFDNAATTFPKPRCVIDELNRCILEYCGNPGRSSHYLSRRAEEEIYTARENISHFIGANNPESVVFTYNATYALNIAIKTFITTPCHIITSDVEHNAIVRPLEKLKKCLGIRISEFSSNGDIEDQIDSMIQADTKGIVSTIESNVTGKHIPLSMLSKAASKHGLFLIIDASQALGHHIINVKETPCDVLCAPTHKGIFGIQGGGFAWFKENERKESYIEGGSGSDSINPYMPRFLPEGYEAGTLSTPAIVTASRGVQFVTAIGINVIEKHLTFLSSELAERIKAIKSATLYHSENGILSFNIGSCSSSIVADFLDSRNICVRSGLHCAPKAHMALGTIDRGTVRASLSVFNTLKEIDSFYSAISDFSRIY